MVIGAVYGKDYVPESARIYKTKAKNAQEAHEAIRPTSLARNPGSLRLEGDLGRLYELIWKRMIASQMEAARIERTTIELESQDGKTGLRATGQVVLFDGYLAVYEEGRDDADDEEGGRLPQVREGADAKVTAARADQHFTEPPPRYSEASLVKTLEEYGIGRPSTYASIISTLQDREYVLLDARRFKPTDTGRIVSHFLTDHFTQYVDLGFTAALEDQLDAISRGEEDWIPVMHGFWNPFQLRVADVAENVSRQDVAQARELGLDPASGKPVSVRLGRFGPFAQIGTKEDEDKPRFASLRTGQSIATISLDEALALFTLPRDLGETAQGEPISVSIGRFGPYVKYGKSYVSLAKTDDPYTVSLERALELIEAKQLAEANRVIQVFASGIQVLNGRYGPYITDGEKNARIPKDSDPKNLSELECRDLLAKAKAPPPKKTTGKAAAKKTTTAKTSTDKTAPAKAGAPKTTTRKKAPVEGEASEAVAKPAPKPRASRAKAVATDADAAAPKAASTRRKKTDT